MGHSLIVDGNGALRGTGRNGSGQLGTGNYGYRNTFIQVLTNVNAVAVGQHHSLVIKSGLMGAGDGQYGQLGTYDNAVKNTFVQAFGIPSVSSIAAGVGSSLALDGVG